jgi:iron complex transport system permease protein
MFKNPMVSPDILGVTQGAGFGAALAILLSASPWGIQAGAFACGLLAVGATCLIALWQGRSGDTTLIMILAGVIVGTVFASFISLIKFVADPYNTLPAVTFWLMGSLASIKSGEASLAALPIGFGLLVLMALRWALNILSFGNEEARALGLNVRRLRIVIIACATLMTASSVAISGAIGLVGLVIPYLGRLLVGPNYQVLPCCILLGALFLLLVDDLARSLTATEIPLGILTSLIGAPFFLYLLLNTRKGWV